MSTPLTSNRRRLLWLVAMLCLAAATVSVLLPLVLSEEDRPSTRPSVPAVDLPNCPRGNAPPPAEWMGSSTSHNISLPSIDGDESYDATVVLPDAKAHPVPRPVLLFQHGLGGEKCALLWLARAAAGQGFAGVVWTAPQGANPLASYEEAVLATRSAFAYVSDPDGPMADRFDRDQVGLVGHSLGSIVASSLQGEPESTPGLRAIVALDNLRRWQLGDPGGAGFECAAKQIGEVTPVVPALGLAMDAPCASKPYVISRDLKLAGYDLWSRNGVSVMELVLKGFSHAQLATQGDDDQKQLIAHYAVAWMRLYVENDRSAVDELLATEIDGRGASDLLSSTFRSAVHIPDLSVQIDDLKQEFARAP